MRHSLRMRISVIFIGLMAIMIVLYWALINIGLEWFYMQNKMRDLRGAYQELEVQLSSEEITSERVQNTLRQLRDTSNISVVLADENVHQILCSTADADRMVHRLSSYIFGTPTGYRENEVLDSSDHYTILRVATEDMREGYLECWGYMEENKYRILLSSPIQSIRDTAEVTSQLIRKVGIAVLIACVLLLYYVTGRIVRPIQELSRVSERMSRLDFDAKYSGKEKDEIGILGQNINQLSTSLEKTISELKTANLELQKDLEQKRHVDEMRKEFISNVSHELKTPIALIQGYAEGLLDGISDDPESQQFYCEVIRDEADKMNQMVRKLLTLTQLEFGDNAVEMERMDLIAVIRGVLSANKLLIDQKEAVVDFPYTEPVYVWADELKCEEVITNFLTNALNHLEGERRIDIRVRWLQEGLVRTSVFNTGKQIPEESLEKVWIKFYKVDKARTREYGGNGIGLSIVKAIMDSFCQKCGVCNHEDGVEFWFDLDGKVHD